VRICLFYIFPQVSPKIYEPCVRRFVEKYIEHPTRQDHDLYVVSNGGPITRRQEKLFEPLVPTFIQHDNSGRDVGAYQMAARTIPCDLLVCLGTPTRPCRNAWLDFIVRAVEDNGVGLYGFWGFQVPAVHIRTTAFVIAPQILNAYPHQIGNQDRYAFEFGPTSITAFCLKRGLPVNMVSTRGVFGPKDFHFVEREDSLLLDQHCDEIWKDI
jgi:hypothetical protein